MRLSDIKGERTFDVLTDIAVCACNIANDDTIMALFKKQGLKKGETARSNLINRLKKAIPALLKNHREDVITILSTIKGVPAETYVSDMGLVSLVTDLMELAQDDAFFELFTAMQTGSISSGSALRIAESQKA